MPVNLWSVYIIIPKDYTIKVECGYFPPQKNAFDLCGKWRLKSASPTSCYLFSFSFCSTANENCENFHSIIYLL